jgi:hypothetical protein
VFVFLSFLPLFTIVASFAQVLSFHTCTITSPFLRNADFFFETLAFPFYVTWNARVSPHSAADSHFCLAIFELMSHCYKNCLDRCEEKWVWKFWGQCTSRRSQLFTWTSCGDTHCPNFHCHYNQRHQNVYPHVTHTKYCPLADHSYAKPWLQLKENKERILMSGPFVAV